MADQPDPLNRQRTLHTYEGVRPDRTAPKSVGTNTELISNHIARHIDGKMSFFHEIVSEAVHVDVAIVEPSEKEPYWTLVTSGMSDKPMSNGKYSELMLRLPPEWKVPVRDGDAVWKEKDERWYWPVRLLKQMARFPHQYDTAFAIGHTVDNGKPADPWSRGTTFNAAFFANGRTLPEEFDWVADGEKQIAIMGLYPLYAEESAFVRREGSDALWKKFVDSEISEVVKADRPSLIPRQETPQRRSIWDRLRGK
jgi:Suppressor of fused protein (SUFU)